MTDPRTPVEELRAISEELGKLSTRLDKLEMPSGTSSFQTTTKMQATLAYLASLEAYGDNGSHTSTGTVPNNDTWYYFATAPNDTAIVGVDFPTSRALVTASVGEASVTPGGSFVIANVSFEVTDGLGNVVPGYGRGGFAQGRLYTNSRLGLSISTGPVEVAVDRLATPPPYTVRLFGGMWVASANTTPASTVFNTPTLRVEVIGDGVDV